ncbi:hypothetical protein Purlil1_13819 [Purpureocillium lilacinum]|uniref:Uncharacterized protein n=1 Tax=Purpureocillium lilacinum TaxID=33203 RepID=A0ABR0BD02_PURLI|nr:hypothetical protein Purlil1_13819 [Purpureocillium lilacinum]
MALNPLNYTKIPQETLLDIYMFVRGAKFSHIVGQIKALRTKGRDDVVAILFRLMREEDYQKFMELWNGPSNHFDKYFKAQESIFSNVPILFPTMAKQARNPERCFVCGETDEFNGSCTVSKKCGNCAAHATCWYRVLAQSLDPLYGPCFCVDKSPAERWGKCSSLANYRDPNDKQDKILVNDSEMALQRATEALERCRKQDKPALPTRRKLKRSHGADDAIVRSAKRAKPSENDGVDAGPPPDTAKKSSKRDRDEAGLSTDSSSDAENAEAKKARINTSQGEEFVAIAKNDDPTRAEGIPVKPEPAD